VNLNRAPLVLALLALLALLCACSGPSPSTTTSAPSVSPSPCQAGADSVTPDIHPLIQVSPTSAATPSSVTSHVRLACHATLSVTRDGAATATFGTVAACKLTQGNTPAGLLVSRWPPDVLFSLSQGKVWCRDEAPQQQEIAVCGQGMVFLDSAPTFTSTCTANHVFTVAVLSGRVLVRTPAKTKPVLVPPNMQLVYDPLTGASISAITFKPSDIDTFDALSP
jgi:hypothetical protein